MYLIIKIIYLYLYSANYREPQLVR